MHMSLKGECPEQKGAFSKLQASASLAICALLLMDLGAMVRRSPGVGVGLACPQQGLCKGFFSSKAQSTTELTERGSGIEGRPGF